MDGNFSYKIFFSDETHFTLDGHVNKQNFRFWDPEDPQVFDDQNLLVMVGGRQFFEQNFLQR